MMYWKMAVSVFRWVCQVCRQISAALMVLKKVSTAALAIDLEPMAHNGAIIAIPLAAHRYLEAVFTQDLLVVVRTLLAAAIAVEDAALVRCS